MKNKKLSTYLFILVFGPFILGIMVQELDLCPFEIEHGIFFSWLDGLVALTLLLAVGVIIELTTSLFSRLKKKDG